MQETHYVSSLAHLARLARQWGYEHEAGAVASANCQRNSLDGVIKTISLPYGVEVCLNDVTAKEDDFRNATLQETLIILLTIEGDEPCYFLDDGRPITAEVGVATVIVAREPLRLWCRNPCGHHCRSMVIQAAPQRMSDDLLASQINRLLGSEGIYDFLVPHPTLSLAAKLFTLCENCMASRLHTHSCVLDLLAQGLCAAERSPSLTACLLPSRDTARILQVRDKLLSQLDNHHCLCDLARDVGISISTLKSKFHAVMGQSVFAFLREQRLMRARQGLESEGWTVKQAAYYVGYQHPSNFSTAYRRKFGRSPRDAVNA